MTPSVLERPLRLMRSYPREAGIAGGLLLFGAAAVASVAHLTPARAPLATPTAPTAVAPPPVPDMAVKSIAPEQALAINQEMPVTAAAGPAAAPFALGHTSGFARDEALNCLSQAIYYEAGNESEEGQRAVGQVILNRVRHPAFPASVCGVVYQGSTRPTGCQFTFTCDGSLARRPERTSWDRARRVAAAALQGSVYAGVGVATHYHADYVVPVWSASLAKSDVVGAHLFYRWQGGWGQPGAFVQQYSGHEASADALRKAALAAHDAYVAAGTPTAGHIAPPIALARAEGLPVTQASGGRVMLHFTPQARAAVEDAMSKPRALLSSDTKLKSTLDAGTPAADQKPFGS